MKRPVSAAIDDVCGSLRLSNRQLAHLAGFSPRAISDWRLGKRPPAPGSARVLVDAVAKVNEAVATRLAAGLGVPRTSPAVVARPLDARGEMEGAVYLAADALGVPAPTLRLALAQVLLQARGHGMTIDEAYTALVPSESAARPRGSTGR